MSDETGDRQHRALRESIGAYLLGQLPAAEAEDVRRHLASCDACRAEHDELAPVATALADVRVGRREGAAPGVGDARGVEVGAPDGLAARVEGAVSLEQRRHDRARWARTAAVAGVAAAVAGVVVVAGIRVTEPDAPKIPLEAVAITREDPGLDASADLVAHTWGVEVKLTATGFDPGGRYRVAVLGDGGRAYPAGEFVGTGSKKMLCNLNSSVLRDRAEGFEVRDSTGEVVLASRF